MPLYNDRRHILIRVFFRPEASLYTFYVALVMVCHMQICLFRMTVLLTNRSQWRECPFDAVLQDFVPKLKWFTTSRCVLMHCLRKCRTEWCVQGENEIKKCWHFPFLWPAINYEAVSRHREANHVPDLNILAFFSKPEISIRLSNERKPLPNERKIQANYCRFTW